MRDPKLRARLQTHRFDAPEGSEPYSGKLASDRGWEQALTARVIEEYCRLLYLTQITGGEAAPSVAVDRAWHIHLTFTRDYCDVLCGKVPGRLLHQHPCKGSEDMDRYAAKYAATRVLYRAEFGAPPPADFWPAPVELPDFGPEKLQATTGAGLGLAALASNAVGFMLLASVLGIAAVGFFTLAFVSLPKTAGTSAGGCGGGCGAGPFGCGGAGGCGGGCGGG